MKITYQFEGETWELEYDPTADVWSGGHPGAAVSLNEAFFDFVGSHEYYPTAWHRAFHVATVLHGTLDTPEPKFDKGEEEGKVY